MTEQGGPRPDFFIVGAAKSGTTAMYEYLRQHPQVFMADAKELNYFGTDLVRRGTQRLSEAQYLQYFTGARQHQRIGEASVRYLRSSTAATEIARFAPGAQAIAMLREPVEMLQSLHAELVFRGEEEIADFGAALDAEADRKAGRRLPATATFPELLFYRDAVRYAEQLERYLEALGRDRVHVLIYDDFQRDARSAYLSTVAFLRVEPSFEPAFPVVNPSKKARSQLLARILSNPPPWSRGVARSILPKPARKRLYKRALALNASSAAREAIDPQLVRQLRVEFAPEIRRLESLLGRELSAWHA